MRLDPNCERCGKVETMEHLLCECENYSEPLWNKLADSLTQLFRVISQDDVPRVDLGQTNIIYNIPHPSIIRHVRDKESRIVLLLLVQEIKRDIVYRRMNLPPSANQIIDPRRLTAHLVSVARRLHSYLQYIGFVKYANALDTMNRLQEILLPENSN
jgi:ribosomal protein S15P/S13E